MKTVREKMDELVAGLPVADGGATAPPFSAGTQPIDQPGATVDSPGADAPRDAKGKFVGTTPKIGEPAGEQPPSGEQPAASTDANAAPTPPEGASPATDAAPKPTVAASATPAEDAGAAAAEAAAAAAPDPFADYEDVEYDDADTGEKFTVRAPKSYAQRIRDGYRRRSAFDRAMTFLGPWRSTLEPLIATGQMKDILPILQRALVDHEFGEYVTEAFKRRASGQSLAQAAAAEAHAAGAAAAAPAPPPALPGDPALDDPWLRSAVETTVRPLLTEVGGIKDELSQFRAERQAEQTRQAQAAAQQQAQLQELADAHRDLAYRLPGYFSGDIEKDNPTFQHVINVARESNYIGTYGLRAGIVMAADALAARRSEAASPAAEALAEVNRATQAANRVAAASAAAVGGGGSPSIPPAPPPKAPPSHLTKNGKIKNAREFANEVIANARA